MAKYKETRTFYWNILKIFSRIILYTRLLCGTSDLFLIYAECKHFQQQLLALLLTTQSRDHCIIMRGGKTVILTAICLSTCIRMWDIM